MVLLLNPSLPTLAATKNFSIYWRYDSLISYCLPDLSLSSILSFPFSLSTEFPRRTPLNYICSSSHPLDLMFSLFTSLAFLWPCFPTSHLETRTLFYPIFASPTGLVICSITISESFPSCLTWIFILSLPHISYLISLSLIWPFFPRPSFFSGKRNNSIWSSSLLLASRPPQPSCFNVLPLPDLNISSISSRTRVFCCSSTSLSERSWPPGLSFRPDTACTCASCE